VPRAGPYTAGMDTHDGSIAFIGGGNMAAAIAGGLVRAGRAPQSIVVVEPDAAARERLVARFDLDITQPEFALGYRFDIVLRGRDATPTESRP